VIEHPVGDEPPASDPTPLPPAAGGPARAPRPTAAAPGPAAPGPGVPGPAAPGSGVPGPTAPPPGAPADAGLTRAGRARRAARRGALAVGWLLAATLIALGGAGIATGVGGPPASTARPELTWTGDRAIEPGLAAAAGDLAALSDLVNGLGTTARAALASMVAADATTVQQDVDLGTSQLKAIRAATDALRARLIALPGVVHDAGDPLPPSTELALGAASRARFDAIFTALDTTASLPEDWVRFTTGSLAAQHLTSLLIDHDTSTAAAAKLGTSGRYREALARLDTSDSLMTQAGGLRDQLANTSDVTTLTEWISRNAAYDQALRNLYRSLLATGGKVDAKVRAAFTAEQAARDRLPPDTRGLVVILADVAQGGLNQAAIGIEFARGQLDDAVSALEAASPPPSPASLPATPSSAPASS
jgi:hypothetical protein